MTETTSTPSVNHASQPDHPRVVAARQRLERLEGFLRQDPRNNALLIDAFETALACGEWARAEFHLKHAQALQLDALAWQLREGDFWLAQQDYEQALTVLASLNAVPNPPPGFRNVLLHNLAYIDLKRDRLADCIERLAPTLEAQSSQEASAPASVDGIQPSVAVRALQQLWLRALHREGQFDRAMAWAVDAEQKERIDPQAAGVASLIAIDAEDFAAARRWAALSLADGSPNDRPTETLVAQASLALAARDAEQASNFADAALQRHPGDGRALSTKGLAALLGNDLLGAMDAFHRALAVMGEHIGTWHGLGWTQILSGQLAEAHASFETALELDRNFAESHGGLAVVLAMQSKREQAQEHAELALRLDKSNVSGRYAQALLSGDVKDAKDLQRLARRLLGGRTAPLGGDMGQIFAEEPAPVQAKDA